MLAVYGESMPVTMLAELVPAEPAVGAGIAAGVIVADGDRLSYRHDLIRSAVEEAISPARRIELHRALARAVETDARVAYHAAAGGLDELAATHALRAAAAAESVPYREATAHFSLALDHGAERVTTLLALGSVAWLADEPARAVAALEEVLALSTETLTRARAHRQLGRAYWLEGRWKDADRAASEPSSSRHPPETGRSTPWPSRGWRPSSRSEAGIPRRSSSPEERSKPRARPATTRRSRAA